MRIESDTVVLRKDVLTNAMLLKERLSNEARQMEESNRYV